MQDRRKAKKMKRIKREEKKVHRLPSPPYPAVFVRFLFLVARFVGGPSPFANTGLPAPSAPACLRFKLAFAIFGVLWLVLPLALIAGLDPLAPLLPLFVPFGIARCDFCGELLAEDDVF